MLELIRLKILVFLQRWWPLKTGLTDGLLTGTNFVTSVLGFDNIPANILWGAGGAGAGRAPGSLRNVCWDAAMEAAMDEHRAS